MKKIILLLSVAVLGFSCSDDEDGDGGSAVSVEALVGTWNYSSISSEVEDFDALDDCEKTSFYTFTTTQVSYEYNRSFFDECESIDSAEGVDFTIVDGKISSMDEDLDGVEVSISGDTLRLTFSYTEDFFDVATGENVEESYTETEVFVKTN